MDNNPLLYGSVCTSHSFINMQIQRKINELGNSMISVDYSKWIIVNLPWLYGSVCTTYSFINMQIQREMNQLNHSVISGGDNIAMNKIESIHGNIYFYFNFRATYWYTIKTNDIIDNDLINYAEILITRKIEISCKNSCLYII